VTELAKRTWVEARKLFDEKLVCIQPIGSTEPHGPHLPLDTDVTIAVAQSKAAVARLDELGVRACLLPPIAYGLTRFTDGFEGTISLRPGTLWAMLEDVVESLSDQGVRRLVLSNGHLEPEHVKVLRGVAKDYPAITRDEAQVVFPDNTRRRWAETLSAEFQSGDCHAGSYETGIIMAADPDAVRDEARRELPALELGLIEKMKGGAKSFVQAGAVEAYCGDPAAASAEEGRRQIQLLGEMIVGTVREAWPELF
jgi:creatinine amidohydrolase